MIDVIVPTRFKHVAEANQIALNIDLWILQGIAHTGLRRQMNDPVELLDGKQACHSRRIGNIHMHKVEVGVGFQTFKTSQLEFWIVVIIEVVESNNLVATIQKLTRNVHADKTGYSGDENLHGRRPIGKYSRPSSRMAAGL